MSSIEHIGWRVVARKACDNFELRQAAEQAMQMLAEQGVPAAWFLVTKEYGREQLERLPFQPQLFTLPAATTNHQKGPDGQELN